MSQKRIHWRTLVVISVALNMVLLAGPSPVGHVRYTTATASVSPMGVLESELPQSSVALKTRLVFSAPPHPAAAQAREFYRSISAYLSRVTGKRIVYKEPGSWSAYVRGMQNDDYDLILDSAHFASWRIARTAHDPIVRMAGRNTFVVLVRQDSEGISTLTDLSGRQVCAPEAPHEAGLILQSQFDNPARRPVFVASEGWLDGYRALIDGVCESAILPLHIYERIDAGNNAARVIFTGTTMPRETLTAGPRVSRDDKAAIRHALLSPESRVVTKALCDRFQSKAIVSAVEPEYAGLDALLRNTWGLDL